MNGCSERKLKMEPIKMSIYAPSIEVPEHRKLRDAIDAALVSGDITMIVNTAGAPIAAIVPVGIAEVGEQRFNELAGEDR